MLSLGGDCSVSPPTWEMGVNPLNTAVRFSQTEDFTFPSVVGSMLYPHPYKEYAHILTLRARSSWKRCFHGFNKMRSSCTTWMGTKSKSSVLRQKLRKRREKMALWRWSQRLEWCCYKQKSAWSHQKVEETEMTLPRATEGEHGPAVKTSKIRGFCFRPGLQDYERIHFCERIKPARLRSLVAAFLEKKTLSWVLSISVVECLVKKEFQQKIKEWKSTHLFKNQISELWKKIVNNVSFYRHPFSSCQPYIVGIV